jgi:hypothetical protein
MHPPYTCKAQIELPQLLPCQEGRQDGGTMLTQRISNLHDFCLLLVQMQRSMSFRLLFHLQSRGVRY